MTTMIEEETETEQEAPEKTPGTDVVLHRSTTPLAAPAQSWEALSAQARELAESRMIPTQYYRKPADICVAGLMGAELGLPLMVSLRHVHVINGKPGLSAEAMNMLIRQAGHSITADVSSTGTKIRARRADNGDEMTFEFTLDDAARAKLILKQNDGSFRAAQGKDVWVQYPAAMCWARALSQVARMLFPDVLTGIGHTPEEIGGDAGDGWIAAPAEVVEATRAEQEAAGSLWETILETFALLPDEGKNRVNGWLMRITKPDGEKAFPGGMRSVDPEQEPTQFLETLNQNCQRALREPKQSVETTAEEELDEVEEAEIVEEPTRTIGDVHAENLAADEPDDGGRSILNEDDDEGPMYEALIGSFAPGEVFSAAQAKDAVGWSGSGSVLRVRAALARQLEYGNIEKAGDDWTIPNV